MLLGSPTSAINLAKTELDVLAFYEWTKSMTVTFESRDVTTQSGHHPVPLIVLIILSACYLLL